MGIYIRGKPRPRRSISDALDEAEEDHFLDCEGADLVTRLAALLLDLIFLFLIHSAIQRTSLIATSYFSTTGTFLVGFAEPFFLTIESIGIYFYCVWTVVRLGGSPAKLLFHLRVIDAQTGQRLSLRRAVVRELIGKYFTCGIFIVGFLWPLLRSDRRALHDLVAGSVVKKIVES